MRGKGALAHGVRLAAGCVLAACIAAPAAAIEFWDGRVEIHGYYENQIRSLWEDFQEDDWDLSQWYHILNLEMEADLAPDGLGPFDLVQAFARVEVRYDCVWTRACGLARSADVYGDRPGRQPSRLSDGRRTGYNGTQFTGDVRPFHLDSFFDLGFENRNTPVGSRQAVPFWGVDGFSGFFGQVGPDGMRGTPENPGDDPPLFIFSSVLKDDCLYGHRKTKGPTDGVGNQVLPVTPGCKIRSIGTLRDKPNPFNSADRNEVVLGGGTGGFALPYRPAPEHEYFGQGPRAPRGEAQGVFYPNERLAQMLKDGEFDSFDQNFRQAELEWNRGASQQDEKELKELYFDLEMFDSRLWLRLGKQNIVWGKTELFRTTDQFNPQDLALASLPSLEESRIALWAVRAVWSFWEVGPFSDVRLEVAANLDQMEPTDLGRCGEPYSPLPACSKTFGLQAHGLTGVGIAGEVRPPDPWNSWKGVEVGARLEWRWDRFSFALSDFYGYDDRFYVDRIFQYSRNVDPRTGRPREGMSRGECTTGSEPACLEPGEALRKHSANQQLHAMVCAASVGVVANLDASACSASIFGSSNPADPTNPLSPTVALALNNIMAGQNTSPDFLGLGLPIFHGAFLFETLGGVTQQTIDELNRFPWVNRYLSPVVPALGLDGFGPNSPTPLVPLIAHPGDGAAATLTPAQAGSTAFTFWIGNGLQPYLNDEQEALLGCGPFYGTQCDIDGMDLLNTEASVLFQSWPVFEGTFGTFWDTTDRGLAQPGTEGYDGGPVGIRFADGKTIHLPGTQQSAGGLLHPFTGQEWDNELAILSWNFLMAAVGLSTGDLGDENVFDPDRPFADSKCSFKRPQLCSFVQSLIDLTSVGRPSVRAGGNGRFGRRDFLWTSGGDVALRYEKRNVLGFSMDWAEDVTKSNWSIESTWFEGLPFANNDALDYTSEVDTYNLTISVDRPTFVNFLNANRTFFMNVQIFLQWVDGYEEGMTANGPWNAFATFAISTGYFQDRLLPSATFVYDMRSNSGAFLPEVTYRFTERFSATFGMAVFMGRFEKRDLELHPVGTNSMRVGDHRGSTFVENGLSPVRERDEVFLRLRYTF